MKVTIAVEEGFRSIGEMLHYHITLENTLETSVQAILIKCQLPEEVGFIEGKVEHMEQQPLSTIRGGIKIDCLPAGASYSVQLTAQVEQLPMMHFMLATAQVSYEREGIEERYTIESNPVTTIVNDPGNLGEEGYQCSVNKKVVDREEELTYEMTFTNTGNVAAQEVILRNSVPEGTSLVEEANEVIELGEIGIGETKKVMYTVKVTRDRAPWYIQHQPTLKYVFSLANKEKIIREVPVRTVQTPLHTVVFEEGIGFCKHYSENYTDQGEQLQCHLMLKNNGNVDALALHVKDTLPEGLTTKVGQEQSFTIPLLKSGEKITLSYAIEVLTMQDKLAIPKASVDYTYYVEEEKKQRIDYSNETTLVIQHGQVTIQSEESIGKEGICIALEEERVQQLILKNEGNVAVEIQSVTLPQTEAYTVEGEGWYGSGNHYEWTQKSVLQPQETLMLPYQMKGYAVLEKSTYSMQPSCHYTYQVGERIVQQKVQASETIDVQVIGALYKGQRASFYQKASATDVQLEDRLTYTIEIVNEGNVTATDIHLQDLIPLEAAYVEGSLVVNGKLQALDQVQVPAIPCGEQCTLMYQVKINAIPKSGIIKPTTCISYTYSDAKKYHTYTKEAIIPSDDVLMKRAQLVVLEQTQELENGETIGGIGDRIQCKIRVKNIGNTAARDIQLEDEVKLHIETIEPDEEQEVDYTVTIPYKAQCNHYSHDFQLTYAYEGTHKSMTETIEGSYPTIQVEDVYMGEVAEAIIQEVSHLYAQIEEEITYRFVIQNMGNREVKDLEVQLPYVEGGEWLDNENTSEKIIRIPTLAIKEKIRLQAQLKVVSLPTNHRIEVAPRIQYEVQQTAQTRKRQYQLPQMETAIRYARLQVTSEWVNVKETKINGTIGDHLTCQLKVKNIGNQPAYGIVLQQWLEDGLDYVQGSIQINQINYDDILLTEPIQLLDIQGDEEVLITYDIQVTSLPTHQEATMNGYLNYHYNVDETYGLVVEQIESFKNTPIKIEATLIDEVYGNFTHVAYQQEVDQKEVLTYTATIHNGGNCIAKDVMYQLQLSEGLQFMPNTLSINQQLSNEDLTEALSIGDLTPQSTKELTFKVEVEEGILRPDVWSYSELTYHTQTSKHPICVKTQKQNHKVSAAGPLLSLHFKQNVTPTHLAYNDVLHMTWELRNGGNKKMIEPLFQINEYLLESLEIYQIRINQMRYKDPLTKVGIVLQDMEPGEKFYIVIEGRVKGIPKVPIQQRASITYRYEGVHGTMKLRTKYSDTEIMYLEDTGLKQKENCLLSADKKNAVSNETIHYTLALDNQGNQKVEQLKVIIKGNTEDKWPIFKEAQIEAYEKKEIQFDYKVPTHLVGTTIQVEAKMIYNVADGNGTIQTFEQYIAPTKTKILAVEFAQEGFTKVLSDTEVTLGEIIHYTLTCLNTGNIEAQDVKLYQQCPKGIVILPHTIMQDGVSVHYEAAVIQLNPLQPHMKSIITFDAKVEEWYETYGEDKTHLTYAMKVEGETLAEGLEVTPIKETIQVISPQLHIQCIPNESIGIAGETVSYQLHIQNKGNREVNQLQLENTLPTCIQLKEESKYNLERYKKSLAVGEEATWSIEGVLDGQIKEESYVFIPQIKYAFELRDQSYTTTTIGEASRQPIVTADLAVYINTDTQGTQQEVGDYITYHIQLHNTGTVVAQQIILYSKLPKGCELVNGSVRIETQFIGGNAIEQGITIGELQPQEKRVITYKVAIKQYEQRELKNEVYCIYHYKAAHNSTLRRKNTPVAEVCSLITSPNKIQKNISYCWTVPYGHEDIDSVYQVEATAEVIEVTMPKEMPEQAIIYAKITYGILYRGKEGREEKLVAIQHIQEKMVLQTKTSVLNEMLMEATPKQYGLIHPRQLAIVSELRLQEN